MGGEHETTDGIPHRATPGYRYPRQSVVVTAAEQERLHGWCGLESARYAGIADPTLVARPPVLLNTATIRASRPDWGPVHVLHHLRQRRAIALDEELTLDGRVVDVLPHRRGARLLTDWRYHDASGSEVFTVAAEVLMIDPTAASAPARPRPPRPAPLPLGHWQSTPETNLGYCAGSTNRIHLDPEFARGFGLRAPIIAGMQTVNWLLAPLFEDAPPAAIELAIRFLAPVFWDDEVQVGGARDGQGRLAFLAAANGAGERVAECEVTWP